MEGNVGDDFNSSDIEFEPEPRKGRSTAGSKSIAQIIADAQKDRLSSKKAIKNLQFGRGAPGTIEAAHLWVQRFNAYRQSTLRQDIELPFNGDDLLRFFDSIIDKVKPGGFKKPAPSIGPVRSGVAHIIAYGTFTYPEASGYKISARDGSRIQTWTDDAVKSGRLIKGRWKKKVWLNFTIVSRMTMAWLDNYHEYGTTNWDIIIAKHLSIVLVTSLGMRVGDVGHSRGYEGVEYLTYKDIHMDIEGDGKPKLENIRAVITLCYAKGKKDTLNDEEPFYFSPLEDSENHMCVISLILIHALRHGLVGGTTIQEVLDNTVHTPDSRIVWLYPDRPVLTAISSRTMRAINLDSAARPCQMLRTIKEMGLISNILSPVTSHALRYGSAQDTAHLTRALDAGFADDTVRQTLGHSASTLASGTTEMYAGKHTRETYNERAAIQYVHRTGARFSNTSAMLLVKGPVSNDEISEWQALNVPDETHPNSQNARQRARQSIRMQRHLDFFATAAPESKKEARMRRVLSDKPSNVIMGTTTATKAKSSKASTPPIVPTPTFREDTSNIDPVLLQEDALNRLEIDKARLSTLTTQVLLPDVHGAIEADDDDDDDDTGEGAEALFANTAPSVDQRPQNKSDFIDQYARVNIVLNTFFAEQWPHFQNGISREDSIGPHSLHENSRDAPTPYLFSCQATPRCPHTALYGKGIDAHQALCSEEYVARALYIVEHGEDFGCERCPRRFLNQHDLNMHINYEHNFVPVPCPEGCSPEKIYDKKLALDAHMREYHTGVWPARCLYPNCDDETKFKSSSYSNHLTKVHHLTSRAARAPYFPATKKNVWQPTACPVENCTTPTLYALKNSMVEHLMKVHNYEREAALELSRVGWVETMSTDVQEKSILRKRPAKPWQVAKLTDDEDVDEVENVNDDAEAEKGTLSVLPKRRRKKR